jgi:hypothetical protein
LASQLRARSREVADLWASWASEIAADVHAFVQAGWTPVFALANVVDGTTNQVYTIRPGDPHPYALIRVLFNVAMCRSWFGPGPWDRVATAWLARHPLERVPDDVAAVTRVSVDALHDIVDVCTRRPMNAFHGAPLTGVIDPQRESPAAMAAFAASAGDTLATSAYLRRRDPLRVFSIMAARTVDDPAHADDHAARLRRWVADLGIDDRSITHPPNKAA